MIKETLFVSKECPCGFFIPRAELLSINLVEGMISFKTEKYLYTYSLNDNKLTLVNLKTGKKVSRDFTDVSSEYKHGREFEQRVLSDLGVSTNLSDPHALVKNLKELDICLEHLVMYPDIEHIAHSEDAV